MKKYLNYLIAALAIVIVVTGFVLIRNISNANSNASSISNNNAILSTQLTDLAKRVDQLEAQIALNENYRIIIEEFAVDTYTKALDGIKNCEIGTAGSSLKCAIASATFLNWTESNVLPEDTIRHQTEKYLNAMSPAAFDQFKSNFEFVISTAEEIVSGSEYSKGLLDGAGNPQKYETYSSDKYEICKQIISDCIR